MAPWFIIVFSLYGLLDGQELQSPSLQECCTDGRDRAVRGQDCTVLPLISSSHICRIAQEQCCASVVEDTMCTSGISMARDQGACERFFFSGDPWETKLSKKCCDCCILGLIAVGRGLSCDQGLSLGRHCEHAAKTCCGPNPTTATKNTTTPATKPTTTPVPDNVTEEPTSWIPTTEPQKGQETCSGSNCSQLCVGNGTCACHNGYRLKADRNDCEDINECLTLSHSCVLGELCINTEGSFRCHREVRCGTGYELTEDNSCKDINECLTLSHSCVLGQLCINTEGSFRCHRVASCGTGYELMEDNSCKDIDECSLKTHNCGNNFVCTNTAGSFRCRPRHSCGSGFIQDAMGSCIDINECVAQTSPCLLSQTCINTVGSFTCRRNIVTCGRGYHLTEDRARCEDVDECRVGHVCVGHGCVNAVGTFRCDCRPGFIFNSLAKQCEDINECRHYPGRLCAHKCDNTEGSYQCSCSSGFKLASDGRNCEDVNECDTNPCSQECANVYGSYQCYCRRGYQLSDIDGITCEDIDECALPTGGHVCSYRCANAPGSFYCTCPPTGYTLSPNGRMCQDIDECVAGTHTCSVSQSCFNVQGGFRCLSLQCPVNFRKAGDGFRSDGTINVRCIKACLPNDVGCAVDLVHLISQTVLSLPNFREFSAPEEIVYLKTMTSPNSPNLPGSPDVFFDIVAADDQFSFDVVKRSPNNMIMGVVRQVKPIAGPRNIVVEVSMTYIKDRVISHRNIIIIHVFISEFWF